MISQLVAPIKELHLYDLTGSETAFPFSGFPQQFCMLYTYIHYVSHMLSFSYNLFTRKPLYLPRLIYLWVASTWLKKTKTKTKNNLTWMTEQVNQWKEMYHKYMFYLIKNLFVYTLVERQRDRNRYIERSSMHWLTPLKDHRSQGWARPKPGAWNSTQVSHVSFRDPRRDSSYAPLEDMHQLEAGAEAQ